MGIQGLIPFCEQATRQMTIAEIKGKTVAVDSYCFLHRGAYSCSDKLVKQIKTTAHIDYCMKYVNMLLSLNITPIMVFDGRNLPAKAQTELKRRNDRQAAKDRAKEFLRLGKIEEARKEFTKAVDITHSHAVDLMRECRKAGVDCITAMYEADSQLAYLNKINAAEYVISEDSDLILFGCKKVIFKLQLDGRCLLFDSEKLHLTMNTTEEKFSFEKFRRSCILSGCDYLDNLHGIGLSKARKFMMMAEETDMRKAIAKIPSYLNMKKLTITDEYIEGFLKAEATFKHMFVYDPLKREMTRLNPLEENDRELENCSNAGELLEANVAYQLALGNINPRTFERSDNFNPDTASPMKKARKHPSIWRKQISTRGSSATFQQQSKIGNFFTGLSQTFGHLTVVQNIIEQENHVTSEVEIGDLVSSYCITQSSSSSKRRITELENERGDSIESNSSGTPTRNPFAKRHQLEKEKIVNKPSLLGSLTKREIGNKFDKNPLRTVSKYFQTNVSQDEKDQSDESDPEMRKMKSESQERQLKYKQFFGIVKSSDQNRLDSSDSESQLDEKVSEESKTTAESQDEEMETNANVVDLDKYEFKPKLQKQTFLNDVQSKASVKPTMSKMRRPGLTKPKSFATQKTEDSSFQTKLSKFGFQKKSTFS